MIDRIIIALANTEKSRMRSFDWHILMLPWLILEVKVTDVHISTVNMSQMVTDGANVVIGNKEKLACGLSISIFAFDVGSF